MQMYAKIHKNDNQKDIIPGQEHSQNFNSTFAQPFPFFAQKARQFRLLLHPYVRHIKYNLKDLIAMQEWKLPKTAWVYIDGNNFKQSTFNIIMRDYLETLKNF